MEKFDKARAYDLVKLFSFPRLAGTEGEKKAVELVIKKFKEIGFSEEVIIEQSFEFSDFYSTTLIKLIMILNLIFNFFLLFFVYIQPILTFIVVGCFALLLLWIIRGIKTPENPGFFAKYYGETITATNVYVTIPAKGILDSNPGNILISAHLDSKSQSFKTAWRIVLYRLWLYNGIILAVFFVLFMIRVFAGIDINILLISLGIWIPSLLISLSNILLMLIDTGNKSPGALDNASGMAAVFELSSYFMKHPLKHFNLWFCQFSAEELGTMGSRFFMKKNESLFINNPSFQINFEMLSSAKHDKSKNKLQFLASYGVFPRKAIAPVLGVYLKEAAQEQHIIFEGFHISTGAHTDTVPFHQRNLRAIDVVTKAAAFWTHSEQDTPDKVDPSIIADACRIVNRAVLLIDNDFEKLKSQHEL